MGCHRLNQAVNHLLRDPPIELRIIFKLETGFVKQGIALEPTSICEVEKLLDHPAPHRGPTAESRGPRAPVHRSKVA